MKKPLAIVAFAAALAALPLSAANSNSNQRSITTMGLVTVIIPADSAKLTVNLSVIDPTLEASNNHLDEVFAALLAELKTRGIPGKSVVLKNREMRKTWDGTYGGRNRTLLGYKSSAQVTISIDDISKLSPLISYLGVHEEYSSWTPDLRSSKIGEERKAVLASALRIARNKAAILAKEGGAKLGALLNASEEATGSGHSGHTYYRDGLAASRAASNAVVFSSTGVDSGDDNLDGATPAGEHTISITVRIIATFALE